jgi:catechol 2,3-dioxygenase-like lactoylglutathione lyase family enzyme
MVYRRNMNHVGISVTDIDAAVKWYHEVFGCDIVMAPIAAKDDGSYFGEILEDIFGKGFDEVKLAHLTTGDGIGIELFEFAKPKPERRDDNFEYWKSGVFHICLTDPDIEGLTKKIALTGGKQRSKVWKLWPDKPYKVCYCEDPWGNIVELSSHSYEQTWANYDVPHKP